jgi:Rrf2 family iron-sulfur cluster assembly transcriptional regulator
MSTFFSRHCEYALQATLYLALRPQGEMISIKELSKKLKIPYHFLGKILQDLSRKGLLVSLKGPTGGFALAKPPGDITLFEIVEAIDGAEFTRSCVLGFRECSGRHPCAVHEEWEEMRDRLHQMLATKSVGQLAMEMRKPEYQG